MKRFAIALSIALSIATFSAYADNSSSNNCGKLSITVTNNTGATCQLVWEHLNHGYYHYSSFPPAFIPSGMTSHPVIISQSVYGPSLELRYQCGENKNITFRSQQNLCFLSAGAIHGDILGIANMTTEKFSREGSYIWNQHGSLQWVLNR